MSEPGTENQAERAWIRLLPSLCLLLTFAFVLWSLWTWSKRGRLDHDELEHAHAAWLVYKGQAPFTDFWEHHPPYYWHFLKQYYIRHGANVGIFEWGRTWMLVPFTISVACIFWIGRELISPACGIAAATLFACNRLLQYPAMAMRPDGWMLCLLLGGLCLFLYAWRRSFSWYAGLLSGLLIGLAFTIHPRAGFTVFALVLGVACDVIFVRGWSVVRERIAGLVPWAVTAATPVVWPFIQYGAATYYQNVYAWSSQALPAFGPWVLFGNIYITGYALLPFTLFSIAVCVASIRGRQSGWIADLWLALFFAFNVLGVCIAKRPFIQAFYVLGPFAALFAARSVSWVVERLRPAQAAVGLTLLVLGGALATYQTQNWRAPNDLKPQLEKIERLIHVIPEHERYVGSMEYHPIFRLDGTRYWFDLSMETFRVLDPSFQHDFVEELQRTKPFLVHEAILEKAGFDPAQPERLRQFLAAHYEKPPDGPLYVRKNP